MIKKIFKVVNIVLVLSICAPLFGNNGESKPLKDGKFLRGEKYDQFSLSGNDADFYVAPNGSDNWSGTLAEPNQAKTDGPFATIGRAKEAIRKLKLTIYKPKENAIDSRFRGSSYKYGKGKDIIVLIREGYYKLKNTLVFNSVDGGERIETDLPTGAFEYHKLKDYYVTYAAYPGEHPLIFGGVEINGWKKERKGIWSTKPDVDKIDELFVNGKRMRLARYPNTGSLSMAEQPVNPNWFKYNKGDIKNWDTIESVNIHMKVRWTSIDVGITRVDEKAQIVYLDTATNDMLFVPPKYYVENSEALLDTAGEYYFNRRRRILKVIPDQRIDDMNNALTAIPDISELIKVEGTARKPVRNLRFLGLHFTLNAFGGKSAIGFEYAKNCELLKNKLTNINGNAVSIGLGCYNNLISGNDISMVKKGIGIINSGSAHPAKWEDINSDNVISYNKIEQMQLQSGGIATKNALRSVISHNYVSGTYSYGITVGSWPNVEESIDGNHLVEYNHISFTNQGRDDEGGMAVYGLSPGSIVRNNLIHDVTPAETNENVGFFFQNMAKGWTIYDNIFYNLKQGELKYCAAYPVDNVYEDNFIVETPKVQAEKIINGKPVFVYLNQNIRAKNGFETGKNIQISATVKNTGATGLKKVRLYIDGKVAKEQKFPLIEGNSSKIFFEYTFSEPGEHTFAVETIPYSKVNISGKPIYILYGDLWLSNKELPAGDTILVKSSIENLNKNKRQESVKCIIDGEVYATKTVTLGSSEERNVDFSVSLPVGLHNVSIGGQMPVKVRFYAYKRLDFLKDKLLQYCSGTAKPCKFNISSKRYEITASGTDFLHAEDSYGAIYLRRAIQGNFVAQVKVVGFAPGDSDWFRAGIFARNDISKSNETKKGSRGSFLMFSTPKRHGAQWDQFGDGSIHNTKSFNYEKEQPFPVWLKVVREGAVFSGYYSYDGVHWNLSRKSTPLPKLNAVMDIGLAAGTNDQRPSRVVFEDFKLLVEK